MELATGLNFWDAQDRAWKESFVLLELFEGGAISRHTASQMIFAPSADDPHGVFDILLPPRVDQWAIPVNEPRGRFRGQCVGVALTDRKSGTSVWIGTVRDVAGLAGDDQVIYPDCLVGEGGFSASVRYTITGLHGLSQDVIINTSLPTLDQAGFAKDADVVLEAWTEVLESPEAAILSEPVQMADGSIASDPTICLGLMKLGHGRAFSIDGEKANTEGTERMPVVKELATMNGGMRFLIESIPYEQAAARTRNLKPVAALKHAPKVFARLDRTAGGSTKRSFVADYVRKPESERSTRAALTMRPLPHERQLAMAGYVVDFDLNGPSTLTNFYFHAETTYYVKGYCTLAGPTVLEAATIKFAKTNSPSLAIDYNGSLTVKTADYRNCILTAIDDDSVGDVVTGSTGNPTNLFYASYALAYAPPIPVNLSHIRVRFADHGVYFANTTATKVTNTLSHAQFVSCNKAITATNGTLHVQNVLLHNNAQDFEGNHTTFISENVTVHGFGNFLNDLGGNTMIFTNSIFCLATNRPSLTGSANVTNDTESAVFQVAGNAANYLTDTYRNTGSSLIDPALLASLRKKTTYPPLVLTSALTVNSPYSFYPAVQRDTDIVDPGYHYEPLDWAVTGLLVQSGGQVTVAPGTVIGLYSTSGHSGFELTSGGTLTTSGTADQPVRMVRYTASQEQATLTNWVPGVISAIQTGSSGTIGAANLSWTEFYFHSTAWNYNYALNLAATGQVSAVNCRFFCGQVSGANSWLKMTNSYLDGVKMTLSQMPGSALRDCTFNWGTLYNYDPVGSTNVTVTDTLFSRSSVSMPTNTVADYNGYETGFQRIAPNGVHDVTYSGEMAYLNGPYGPYYQSVTNLHDVGSTYATNVGLYHFTSQANGLKEAGSVVDIGYHVPVAQGSGTGLTNGLVAWWKVDEGSGTIAADAIGIHTGTLTNGAGWTSGDLPGSAVLFNGTNQYVTTVEDSSLRITGDLTLALWLRKNAEASDWSRLLGKGSFSQRTYGLWEENGSGTRLMFQEYNGNTGDLFNLYSASGIVTGVWYHAAAVVSGTNVSIYINGVLDSSGSRSFTPPSVTNAVTFAYDGNYSSFPGALDDIRIYNRALSYDEIASIAASPPWDADGDGTPDYLEDRNGNGTVDTGETDWMTYNSLNGLIGNPAVQIQTPVK